MRTPLWSDFIDTLPLVKRKLEQHILKALGREFAQWLAQEKPSGDIPQGVEGALFLAGFLVLSIRNAQDEIDRLRASQGRFLQAISLSSSEAEQHSLLLKQALALGADADQIAGDESALVRWLGADALTDRYGRQVTELERRITVCLMLLGRHAKTTLLATETPHDIVWNRLNIESVVRTLFAFDGQTRIRHGAFLCLAEALRGLKTLDWQKTVKTSTVQYIYRYALETRQDVWLQIDAIELLATLAPRSFLQVLRRRLTQPPAGDDFFVRRRTLLLAANMLDQMPEAGAFVNLALSDPSPYVRQGLAQVLEKSPVTLVTACLPPLLADPVPQVRAQALLVLMARPAADALPLVAWLAERLSTEQDAFVLRTALHVAEQLVLADGAGAAVMAGAVRRLHEGAPDLRVRRWAANTLAQFALVNDADLRALVERLRPLVLACPPGGHRALATAFNRVTGEQLGLAALHLTRNDFGLHFERYLGRWHVYRGHRFELRFWRALHELSHPSPDKRQGFRHTVGRVFNGHVHVPSQILAELAQTKVPGEPLQMASEAGWRPYLPLMDEMLSSLDLPARKYPLRIYTAEGVTEVTPPRSILRRLWIQIRMSLNFARLAQARNWTEGSQQSPDHYVRLLMQEGFALRFVPHGQVGADAAVQRFFPAGFALVPGNGEMWSNFQTYFFSVYGNSLTELIFFLSLALLAFVLRHQWANLSFRRARAMLPLVIGGWGTRGKSGTERLKAALFNSLGYAVVSKTTGCEAMFLHCHAHQPLREMFLFRPYDKATIWEQYDLTRLAVNLKAEVFLWECMALTPSFVKLLQRRWMHDDLSTITNTFPDHEDLQGPAGINIPEVMTNFIPHKGTMLTSEEQMRPILATAAQGLGTRFEGVGWLESGLLAPDILARFPYQEHPDNIALVVRMAAELDIEADYALKEMADRVVPDLGVLKVYPQATLDGRVLSFANGMSANERFGCLGNWTRLKFDQVSVDALPGVLISTVVNNRADRIARSRVFASVLVRDISADLHFLIGSNLEGFNGYVRESWLEYAAELSLWPDSGESPLAVLEAQAQRLRLSYSATRVQNRLKSMLGPHADACAQLIAEDWEHPDALAAELAAQQVARAAEIVDFVRQALLSYQEYQAFSSKLAQLDGRADAGLDTEFRELLWRWFERKLVTVTDYYANGNQIIQTIAQHTPPGCHNRVMGIQNIKGTGLDFVYRWQAWAQCHTACASLAEGHDSLTFRRSLADLAAFQEYGLLSEDFVLATLASARHAPLAQLTVIQAQLVQIKANLEHAMVVVRAQLQTQRQHGWLQQIVTFAEGFVDAGDAVRRRKVANQIYKDLVSHRISHARAAIELLKLTNQQKGGWLYDRFDHRLSLMAESWRHVWSLVRRRKK